MLGPVSYYWGSRSFTARSEAEALTVGEILQRGDIRLIIAEAKTSHVLHAVPMRP